MRNIDVHKVFADYFDDPIVKSLAYAVSKNLSDGHICLDIESYNASLKNISNDDISEFNPFIEDVGSLSVDEIRASDFVSEDASVVRPFIFCKGNVYLHRYYEYESEIIDKIKSLLDSETVFNEMGFELVEKQRTFIEELFLSKDTDFDALSVAEKVNWQLVACIKVMFNKFSIITGGPGTGKTTTVAKILALQYKNNINLKVAVAAPTGKAAARMKESLRQAGSSLGLPNNIISCFNALEAKTIHRLLGSKRDSIYFKHNESNPLDFDFIIIDESSMISAPMMAKILAAVAGDARIVFLGDRNQLASVEAGSVFGDICLSIADKMNVFSSKSADFINSFISNEEIKLTSDFISDDENGKLLAEHVVELKRSYRFKDSEGIGLFSKAVISGCVEDDVYLQSKLSSEFVKLISAGDVKFIDELILRYREYIEEKDILKALTAVNKIRFLCAVHSGPYGVEFYNKYIESCLSKKNLLSPLNTFYHNQPILITKNNYDLDLFNGDIGLIREDENGVLRAWFESDNGELKCILPGYINSYSTVFAMTIHKSQGSEFHSCVVVLPKDENLPILTRELLYTGITRGKKEVYILGARNVVDATVKRKVSRASGISKRI